MREHIGIGDLLQLGVAERIQLVQDLWDSVTAVPEGVPLTEGQKQELERRLSAFRADPTVGDPWEAVKARVGRRA